MHELSLNPMVAEATAHRGRMASESRSSILQISNRERFKLVVFLYLFTFRKKWQRDRALKAKWHK